jgi:LacI family transcriptional regulator
LDGIDCIFAVNDIMAVGAMAALRDHGFSVPGDVALAGFDDIATLRDVAPRLTTVRMPLTEIGTQAVKLVLQPPAPQPRLRRVKGDVVLRESTPGVAPKR